MLFGLMLRTIVRVGSLRLIDGAGRVQLFGDGSKPTVGIRLTSTRLGYSLAFNPALSIGEAYMNGGLVVEEGTLYDFLALLACNYGTRGGNIWLSALDGLSRGLKQSNPRARARKNVAHHYDLSDKLYDVFLDSERQYSCAYFATPDDSLEEAQARKMRHLAAKLLLDEGGLRILDIGSGWGGLACHLARAAGDAEVSGITLSTEQLKGAEARARQYGLDSRVHFELRDYREMTGRFDRIVSVGMFEHVGKRHYAEFFAKLHELLADDGVAVLHTIGYSDKPAPINPFIRKYIFPGADLPSLSELLPIIEKSGLFLADVEVLRLHYAYTLRHWRKRCLARRDEIVRLYDERFFRMWEFYLALCEVGFRFRTNVVFQLQLSKRLDTVPLTRDYMFDRDRRQSKAFIREPASVELPDG
jgi:cyclopropane-fatty-acyl-phospholipid synthase